MKKLLLYNDLIRGGGVEKLMYDLVIAFRGRYDITVMSYAYDDTFYELYPEDIKYISVQVPHQNKSNFFAHVISSINRRIYEATFQDRLEKEKFDILLCLKEGCPLKDSVAYKIPRKFAWVHTDYNAYYYTKYIFESAEAERQAMAQFEKVICVSQDIKKSICEVIGDPGNLVVRYNPINIENVLEKAEEPVVDIDSMDEPEETRPVRFVSVGRLNMQKGYDMLIEATKILEDEGYAFEVIVVGGKEPDGVEENKLQLRKKLIQNDRIYFIGARQNPYKYIKSADWFISSSIFEGYSLVSQESAVLDIPMLLTDCSGVRELLGDDEYGIVMPISVSGIYHGMKKVLDNPSLHEYYKNKIIERKSIITYDERINEIEKLFY